MDALSEVLRVVQLTGAVFLDARFSAPWCLTSEQNEALCSAYLPPSDRVVSFHFITAGKCWAMLPADPAGAIDLSAGDILVVPQGEAHIMGSARDLQPVPAAALLADKVDAAAGAVMTLVHGGGGEQTQIVCGFLAVQEAMKNPLLAALPRLFKVDMRGSSAGWLESSLHFAEQEAAGARPGGATVLSKLSELLFVEAIRRYVDSIPEDRKGWLGGLRERSRSCMSVRATRGRWKTWHIASGYRVPRWRCASPTCSACRRCSTSRNGACSLPRNNCARATSRSRRLRNKSATNPKRHSIAPSNVNSVCRRRPGEKMVDPKKWRILLISPVHQCSLIRGR